jgi:hypothetical protein
MTSEIKHEQQCQAGAQDRQCRYEERQGTPGSLTGAGERR